MGSQANLCHMLNAPEEVECPECKKTFRTYFDDYDIDGPCNLEPGVWKLQTQCPHCDEEGREVPLMVEIEVKPAIKVVRYP